MSGAPARLAPLLALLLGSGLAAQTAPDTLEVDLATALRMGLEARPDLRAAEASVAVARGERRQARVYPYNPGVSLKASSFDLGTAAYEAVIGQEIEWAGQWWVRRGIGNRMLDAAEARREDARIAAAQQIQSAFFAAWAADRRHEIRARDVLLRKRVRDAVAAQLREGKVSTFELNLASVQQGLAGAAERAAFRDRVAALLELGQALGLSPDRPVRASVVEEVPDLTHASAPDEAALVVRALTTRPDLIALRADREGARGRARLLTLSAIPNVTIEAIAEGASGEPRLWFFRAGMSVPLFNRQQGAQDATQGEAERVDARVAQLELAVQVEVRRAVDAWRSAAEALQLLAANVLGPARENQDLVEIAYGEGKFDLPTTLLLQSQLLEGELAYVEARLDERQAAAELGRAIGALDFEPLAP